LYLQRASTKEVRTVTTDATGFFGVVDLPPDAYRLGLRPGAWVTRFRRVAPGAVVVFNLLQHQDKSIGN
jgi:hypothetical protein